MTRSPLSFLASSKTEKSHYHRAKRFRNGLARVAWNSTFIRAGLDGFSARGFLLYKLRP
jgi:hypothetical protein